MDKVRVASLQFLIKSADTKWNTEKAIKWIDMAVAEGAQIICLPDHWNTGYPTETTLKLAETVPGPSINNITSKAIEHKVAIIAGGILEKRDGKIYDTCAIVGPSGELLGKHSKTHLHWRGSTYFEELGLSAGKEHNVFDIPGMCKVGVLLDVDLDPSEPARILALKDAEIIFSPMCCPVIHLNPFLPQCRAKENGVYVVVSNLVGKEQLTRQLKSGKTVTSMISYEGASLITNTSGDLIAFAGARFNDGMAMATLDLAKMRKDRDVMSCLSTREPRIYADILK